ncbi:hypothetical protein ZWY2020_049301 [Hordeum vulgare]|nr:hypothetical protein ZWY2020_049301 [Hordeum vulgare]
MEGVPFSSSSRFAGSGDGAAPCILRLRRGSNLLRGSAARSCMEGLVVSKKRMLIISIVKEAQTMLDPDLLNIIRFTIAAIPFVLFLLKSIRDMQVVIRGVELGIWVTLAYLTQSIGLVTADAGRASFISALTVIIVPFLDVVLHHVIEHISRKMKKENFLALVVCQVVVVAVVLAVSFIVKCFLQNVVPWTLKSRTPTELFSMMSSFPWLAILYTGIIATTFCLWAEIVAMRDVSATETAIIYGLEPVWGATFAWAIHGERWDITGLIGAVFIIPGSLMVQVLGSFLDIDVSEDSYQMNS